MNLLTRAPKNGDSPAQPTLSNTLGTHFLDRLARLRQLREASVAMPVEPQRKLIDHALYSTYWDCMRLGLKTEAEQALRPIETSGPR